MLPCAIPGTKPFYCGQTDHMVGVYTHTDRYSVITNPFYAKHAH